MQAATKKPRTEPDMMTLRLRVHRDNVEKIREYARIVESGDERTYTLGEVFPEYQGKEGRTALRAYRNRESLTQAELARMTGIPQHQISEMETGKRTIGKERARKLAQALNVSDFRFFL
ncbi:helix-turn-helix domain-containing protein [Desulfonatronum thioautotrophicum]|uniref:helix-turn-helix domain-containing protein n=1 Tax=Desulfonatronum thioautotrophicum TaxID=617001 RepID=UPI0005EB800A|nr:helix-turn-helix transcriptional regulator [Desulfonatronum thioautotrophicum]